MLDHILPSIVGTFHAFEAYFRGRTYRIQMTSEVIHDLPIDTVIVDELDTLALLEYLSYEANEVGRFQTWLYNQHIISSIRQHLHAEALFDICLRELKRGLFFCVDITETQWEYVAKNYPYSEPAPEPENIWPDKIVQIINEKDNWIKIEVKDSQGQLVPNCEFEITDISGKKMQGMTGENGIGKQAGLPPGSRCTVSFPQWIQAKSTIAARHTVKQGETLLRIAQQYGFTESQSLYQHPTNKAFRQLRSNPNLICAGDEINIPHSQTVSELKTLGRTHTFIKPEEETEHFELKLESGDLSLAGKRAVLTVGKQSLDTVIDDDNVLRVDLKPDAQAKSGKFELYDHPDDTQPCYQSTIQIGHLDPVEALSGVQARCNALGFPCGVVDGIMGSKTREGIRQFQQVHGLSASGKSDTDFQEKLKTVYGC